MSKALQVTSVGWLLISLGHTVCPSASQPTAPIHKYILTRDRRPPRTGRKMQSSKPSRASPMPAQKQAALINYAWSKNPALLRDPVQKAVAGAMIAIMWASGWWYAKNGVTSNAVAVGAIGALQGYSAFTI
ncbi:hypothetical protein E5D57_007337 [Metarhizium anisopliae]|nr:hypothetical protein E5D57_007337 [Metarhizium anisopliae]